MDEPAVLRSRDGSGTTLVCGRGGDADGPYLCLEHRSTQVRNLAGPHWHPELSETFTVRAGRLGLAIDGVWRSIGPGGSATVSPRQVHASRCEAGELVMDHVVRPPAQHQEMFEVMYALDATGRLSRWGLPRDPRALGLLWGLQDGYVAGPPPRLQELVLGGLDRLARRCGYHRRLAASAGYAPDRWERR